MIEAYFDGAVEPINPGGHGSYGVLIRENGKTLVAYGGYCGSGSSMSNNVAEYQGFISAAKELLYCPGPITIKGDSKLVVEQLNGRWRAKGGLYLPFYLEAKTLWGQLKDRAKLIWVPRELNYECDKLSKDVLKSKGVRLRIQPE